MFLEISGLKKSFGSGSSRVDVLKGIDLSLERGEFCVLLGPSGSGKSTLLNIIGGIDTPDSGDIVIDGERMGGMSEKKLTFYRRRHLGYIFQMYNLIPNLTVRENIEVGSYLAEKPVETKVPFTAMTAALLPKDVFSSVEITNGRLLEMGSLSCLVGYAFPGLEEALRLGAFEETEDVELPEYVELEADVTDFELAFTTTIFTPGLFKDLDLEKLDDIDDLTESMDDLRAATDKLEEGSSALAGGPDPAALTAAMTALGADAAALAASAQQIGAALPALQTAAGQIKALAESAGGGDEPSADDLQTAVSKAKEALKALETAEAYGTAASSAVTAAKAELEATSLTSGADPTETARAQAQQALSAALTDPSLVDAEGAPLLTEEQKAALLGAVSNGIDLSGTVTDNSEAASHIEAARSALAGVAPFTPSGVDTSWTGPGNSGEGGGDSGEGGSGEGSSTESDPEAIAAAVSQAASSIAQATGSVSGTLTDMQTNLTSLAGGQQLDKGFAAFAQASGMLSQGIAPAVDGASALADGIKVFNDEAISEITKLGDGDLQSLASRIRAIKKADALFETFTGLPAGQTGSVSFVIETEEIELT